MLKQKINGLNGIIQFNYDTKEVSLNEKVEFKSPPIFRLKDSNLIKPTIHDTYVHVYTRLKDLTVVIGDISDKEFKKTYPRVGKSIFICYYEKENHELIVGFNYNEMEVNIDGFPRSGYIVLEDIDDNSR